MANLYYSHPILNILAAEFNVTNERASIIPTVMQAGYASGLLFLCPLGDIFKRRTFVLSLVFFTATMVSLCTVFIMEHSQCTLVLTEVHLNSGLVYASQTHFQFLLEYLSSRHLLRLLHNSCFL